MNLIKILLFFSFLTILNKGLAQETFKVTGDTIKIREIKPKGNKKFDPDRAALLSAVFPGLGQLYNRAYLKLPLVAGGVGVFYYLIKKNNSNYISYRNAVINNANPTAHLWVDDGIQQRIDRLMANSPSSVTTALDNAERRSRRNRDFTIILAAGTYGIIIADAYVDAHLKGFKISKDLSFKPKPSAQPTEFGGAAYGFAFTFSLN
jgi:hypothetical protein